MIWRMPRLIAMVTAAFAVWTAQADAGFSFQVYNGGVLNGSTKDTSGQFTISALKGSDVSIQNMGDGTQEAKITFASLGFKYNQMASSSPSFSNDITIVISDAKGTSGDLVIDESGTGTVTPPFSFPAGGKASYSLDFAIRKPQKSVAIDGVTFEFLRYDNYTIRNYQGLPTYTVSKTEGEVATFTAVYRVTGAVPEPSSLVLVALGGLGLGAMLVRGRRAS